ncbi:MAG: ribosome biogenesis protein tsr1 [Ramalina farinacea]|uniref:Ribosome biogenesis protein tsr1 n=1 Tax=Ramalina farinacea TaxID=258253 RepID=A0AA43QYS5_9LECA|nr:ribosome biogenesis protein tsr1 [Ramalina farinacea]
MISTSTESPLALLDLIQVFVEALDRLFENVCELDLIFNFETLHATLGEMIVGGVVVETSLDKVVKGVREQGKVAKRGEGANVGGYTSGVPDAPYLVKDDLDLQATARTYGHFLAVAQVPQRNLKLVSTRTWESVQAGVLMSGPAMAPEAFHHRKSSQNTHKPFKSRHTTKSVLKELSKGKTEGSKRKGRRETPHQQVMSKIDRRNKAKQVRDIKDSQNAKRTSIFRGVSGAPRVIAVVPLCEDVDVQKAIERLGEASDSEAQWPVMGHLRVRVDRFKQNLTFVKVRRTLVEIMDACRVADFIVFVLSAEEEAGEEGEMMLRAIEGQGVSSVLTMVQGLDSIEPAKRRAQVTASLKSWITHFFPSQERIFNLDSDSESANVVRSLCSTTPKQVRWREDRSWMLIEDVEWPDLDIVDKKDKGEVVLTGVVRGKGMKANRLVQAGDWGHYQIDKITNATLPISRKRKADEMKVDQPPEDQQTLDAPDADQETLDELAPYEAPMDDVDEMSVSEATSQRKGVLLDDHHYYSDDETHLPQVPKRLPKGTSNYQSAWFLGDMSDSGSDYEEAAQEIDDIPVQAPALPQDGLEGIEQMAQLEPTENASEYPQSEMFLDPSPNEEAGQIEAYRASRKDEAKEDLEYPDEIELHPNVLARERLAKYRGLKSLRTSPWDTTEDRPHEPEDWNRLLPVPDYRRACHQVENEALIGGVDAGTRVHIHLRSVPLSLRQLHNPTKPLALSSLLRHEHKHSVINVSITLSSSHPVPLRSKDELLLQVGPRRFLIHPLFSHLSNTPNDVHQFLRYLHPGRTAVATFIGPITWGPVPALFFQRSLSSSITNNLNLIATGTILPPPPPASSPNAPS